MSKLLKIQGLLLAPVILTASLSVSAVELGSTEQQYSYTLGYRLGKMLQAQGIGDLETNAFAAGMKDYLTKTTPQLDDAARSASLDAMNKINQKKRDEKAALKVSEGKKFLEDNAKKEGVVVLESGLQYKVTEAGSGESPKLTDKVEVHYEGQLLDGTVFDSSIKRGKPAQFALNGVIPGFKEALSLMKPGAKWRIYVPSELAYGKRGAGKSIGPNETLIFDMNLIRVVK